VSNQLRACLEVTLSTSLCPTSVQALKSMVDDVDDAPDEVMSWLRKKFCRAVKRNWSDHVPISVSRCPVPEYRLCINTKFYGFAIQFSRANISLQLSPSASSRDFFLEAEKVGLAPHLVQDAHDGVASRFVNREKAASD